MTRDLHSPAWIPWRARDVLAALAQCDAGQAAAVLLVLSAEGSTPAKSGARALLLADGTLVGTVGGGLVEAEACRRAVCAVERQQAEVFEIQLYGQTGPICGGRMRLLVDPLPQRHQAACAQAGACVQQRRTGLLLTRIWQDATLGIDSAFLESPALENWAAWPAPQVLRQILAAEEPRFLQRLEPPGSPCEVLVEPVLPAPRLVIAGGGHVGQAVAALGYQVGMDVVVIDDRPEFAHPGRFPPGTLVRCGPIAQELKGLTLDAASYVVIVTRNHELDAEALEACLDRPVAYIGMIGSRRKVARVREGLLASGRASSEAWARIHAPIGLDLGAVSVPEIAVSILAEIIAVRRRRPGQRPASEEGR